MLKSNVYLLSALSLFGSLSFVAAQQPALSVKLVTTYSYSNPPYTLDSTEGINDSGVIAGVVTNGETIAGIIRDSDGQFSAPTSDPAEGTLYTQFNGINNNLTVAGWYYTSDGVYHGLFYSDGAFTTYDAPGKGIVLTVINGLNNAGDFVGEYAGSGNIMGFVVSGGQFTRIAIKGTSAVSAGGINNLGEIAGTYQTGKGSKLPAHGFFRAADGTITKPVDYRNASDTYAAGINDSGLIVGTYKDKKGYHGFVLQLPSTFVSYDVPKSDGKNTQFAGINSSGMISGFYTGKDGEIHGVITQVKSQ